MGKTVLALTYLTLMVLHTFKHTAGCYRPIEPCVLPQLDTDSLLSQMVAGFCPMGLILHANTEHHWGHKKEWPTEPFIITHSLYYIF